MRVLGIDPGSRVTGFGLVEKGDVPLAWGVIRLKEKDLAQRLFRIYSEILAIIKQFEPEVIAFEEVIPETYPRAALKLGQAQGAALLAAAHAKIPVFFYHPLEIKKAITGYGNASKEQLRYMVINILGLEEELPVDASDALSVALYHLQNHKWENVSSS
ncbi:crossover junction endodeoxyribonuclease RuvC [Thermodesulfatator indicus DSM 15286]|uniref:Crossover junction endodeoxyribonuclease RuvC n=1 Tax=Thermodesulfatator indicus (strain DSM 15286 / JCM 11887 / CIR29812) TaxID=667014 RepID=F8AC65_THEID|nr:crossover junction endodeoxyribonuclease RuvC [Thermodesulfatator indicus]AEH44623.1 crossover junction endodeoxyribonuclease RuvC [Thermodesulfatator indicus DSM 15286]